MKDKDEVIAVVVIIFVTALCLTIGFFAFDFLVHIAERLDYPVWKISILYFSSLFVIIAASILGNKR